MFPARPAMRSLRNVLPLALLASMAAAPAMAQGMTEPAQVRPILEMTRANWVAIGKQESQDLFYFTHLAAWRCALEGAEMRINGAKEAITLPLEPCYRGTNQPNAIRGLPFISFPPGHIEEVELRITYTDGETDSATFLRTEIVMP
ncbi:MAG: hypothetical protein JJU40_00965 [Rhodobacteraceae bacterium]|nr:hypothetical protein [Paracoccaceae bacterium]